MSRLPGENEKKNHMISCELLPFENLDTAVLLEIYLKNYLRLETWSADS